ncbi:MAG: hypothetical protein GVY29_10090 [Spirochaetes bacterium]|jgi:hypothetical protein|nr:hypothetical protein [Spirochaetota bacterium]
MSDHDFDKADDAPRVTFVGEEETPPAGILGMVTSSSFCVQDFSLRRERAGAGEPLPDPAPLWMRLPVIRHLRVALVLFDMWNYYGWCRKHRMNITYDNYDRRCVRAIWRGKI